MQTADMRHVVEAGVTIAAARNVTEHSKLLCRQAVLVQRRKHKHRRQ
jgi:hypothetical protein